MHLNFLIKHRGTAETTPFNGWSMKIYRVSVFMAIGVGINKHSINVIELGLSLRQSLPGFYALIVIQHFTVNVKKTIPNIFKKSHDYHNTCIRFSDINVILIKNIIFERKKIVCEIYYFPKISIMANLIWFYLLFE